jgi:hypothetical protein
MNLLPLPAQPFGPLVLINVFVTIACYGYWQPLKLDRGAQGGAYTRVLCGGMQPHIGDRRLHAVWQIATA